MPSFMTIGCRTTFEKGRSHLLTQMAVSERKRNRAVDLRDALNERQRRNELSLSSMYELYSVAVGREAIPFLWIRVSRVGRRGFARLHDSSRAYLFQFVLAGDHDIIEVIVMLIQL